MSDPFIIAPTVHAIVANSGGKTSGFNLYEHLKANGWSLPSNAACLFNNTGWEHELTLDFLAEQERRWQVPILMLEFTRRPATAGELKSR